MAATTPPSSRWVSTYSDKSDEWVRARLEYFENKEWQSRGGSIPRRKEIRVLRVELSERKKAVLAAEAAEAAGVSTLADPVTLPEPATAPPGLMGALKRIVTGR